MPNRSRRYYEEVAIIHRRTIQEGLNDPDNHNDVITHPEPDILKCGVKWSLGRYTINKVIAGDGIPAELFKIFKDDAVKVPVNLENSAVATGLEKVSFHSNPKEREC